MFTFSVNCFTILFSRHWAWISVTVCRSPGGAEASVCSHGELGPECVCGAEDLVGSWRLLLLLSDGAHHGGGAWDLPSGKTQLLWFHIVLRSKLNFTLLEEDNKNLGI